MAVWLPGPVALSAEGFWILNNAGNWTGTSANWQGGSIPNAVGDIANFRNDITAARTITLNSAVTLGGLSMGDLLGGSVFTFAGTNALTLDNTSGNAFVKKFGGATDVWQAPLILTDSVDWNIYAGTLDVTGASNAQVSYTGAGSTIKNGAGALRLNINTGVGGVDYTGNWIVNFGTLNIGGANGATPTSLGTGTGGIILNGTGRQDLAIFSLNNNGSGSDGSASYSGNNNVIVQGGAAINVDRNYIGGANDRVAHILNNLTFNGGILRVQSSNGHRLQFDGTTTLNGQTNVFDVLGNSTATLPNLTLNGAITDGAATRNLIKEGAGRMAINSLSNNYDGVTVVKNGVLQLGSGAGLGMGSTIVNGGALSVSDAATLDNLVAGGGLTLVGQLGTSRYILPVVGYSGTAAIDGANQLNFTTPIAGAILGIDGVSGTGSSFNTANIDMANVAGGSNRVWVGNVLGFDRAYRGTLTNGASGDLRLTSGGNTLILDTNANILGGAGATNNLVFGFDHQNANGFTGNNIVQASTGTVSVRVNNASTLGTVTVNRGVTLNINGAGVTTPVGTGVITALGGTISTDNATDAKFGNTDFRLYGGSTLLLDNSNVTSNNADRRLLNTTDINLTSSTLRLIGDGGVAVASSQAVNSIDYNGGSTLSIDTDVATAATRLTSLTTATLNRTDRGTLNIRNISNIGTTFGTSAGTQKLIVTSAPTVTNGMIGANIALWGGANANDGSQPLFVTYDGTHGVQAATFNLSGTAVDTATELAAATATQIVSIDALTANMTVTTGNVQALRIRTTANTNQQVNTGTITIGASAGSGQGAGLFLAHTADNENTHSANFTFAGGQEGLIYTSTTGGSSIVRLNGNITGTNGLTTFGDGALRLGGTNNFGGPLTINAGQVRLASVAAAGPVTGTPTEINLWGGALYSGTGQRFNNNVNFYNDARFGNDNVGSTMFNNMTVQPRTGSTAPVVVWVQNTAGTNFTTANGVLNLAGPAQLSVVHALQVNGGLTGSGNLDKFMNDRLVIAGDSSSYTGNITAYAGVLQSYTSSPAAKPFGATNTITINPGAHIVLAAPSNINPGQVTVNSDHGGISTIGQFYVGDPSALPITVNSSAPHFSAGLAIGAVGYSQDIDQSSLFGGNAYLGAVLGYSGIFTGNLTPATAGYLLGTSQGTLRVEKPLTGTSNAIIGISMTGTSSRADQVVNNSGGTVQFTSAMTYSGNTILNPGPLLRISAKNALTATGNFVLAGGQLRADSASGQNRMIAPIVLTNTVVMTADSTIQMENSAYDFRIGGNIQLAPGSTGVVRTLAIGTDQPGAAANNAGMVYLDGGISDGPGGSGNHFMKNGVGTLFFTGTNTYTGTTTIQQGLIGINADSDWGLTTGNINSPGGGIAIWENSFTTAKNYSAHGGNLHVDVAGGLTLTQDAASVIDGTSSIVKRGLGTLILNGENAVTGLFAGDGILQFNNLISTANSASTGNYSIGGDVTLGGANNGTRYTGGTMRFNFTGTTTRTFAFNNNGNTGFAGGIDVTAGNTLTAGGVISQGSELDFGFKTGAGTLITTAANTWRGLAMNNGVLQFANSTPWANSTATPADNTFIEMMGGTIRAINTGANIALANAASTTTYNYGGGMILSLGSGAGFSAELAADNLIRQNQGTLVIQTEGATTLGAAGNTNAARLIVTNAVNASLARISGLNNGIFPAHLIGANASGAGFFLQNNATTGFEAYSGSANTSLSGLAPIAIGDISSAQALTGLNSIYAFRTTADVSGGTLNVIAIDNVKSGGILINGSNTISSNLVFDPTSATAPGTGTPGEGLVFVKSGETAVISGGITANAFTKFGLGTLTLSGSNAIMGDVSVQSGTLRLGSGAAFSRMNTELNVNAGATLDLNGNTAVVETVGGNNRTVAGAQVGGTITNSSGTAATLAVASPITSTLNGVLSGNLKLLKAGIGTLTINGYSASTPDAGLNTHTGGTDIFGYNTTGGINLNNTTTGLGGGTGGAPTINLYSGQFGLFFSNGTTGVNGTQGMQFNNQVVRIGGDGAAATLNVFGPALLNVNQATPSSSGTFGQGNIMTFGAMNLSNTTLQITGGNLYRARAEGPITILGSQAAIQTNQAGTTGGALELTGVISGSGALTKLGDGTLFGIVISNPNNTYSGGTNIVAGDVQVTATSGTPLGSGPVRVFPDGTLRLAGNGSVNGANLTTISRVSAMGAVMLDDNFNPTVLNSTNFSSAYNTSLQLAQPYFTQALNLAAIGDGRAFLGTGVNGEVAYTATTLGAGVADAWNPGVGVYRIAPATSSFAFSGADNVLTGNNYLQVGPQRQNVLGGITNGGNPLVIRNSNDYSGGTQITKSTSIYIETGGRASGESPLGSGAVEVYGELRVRGAQGSLWNANTSAMTNTINLRPGGVVRLHDGDGVNAFQFVGAGNQGRWGDAVGLDLNGGSFIYQGAPNLTSTETIGAITARKAGQLQVFRNSPASAAILAVSDISRAERGVLTLQYSSGFLGINTTTPLSFERITTGTISGAAITRAGSTTNGSGVVNGGMVAPWIIDRTTNSFVGYDPTSTAGTGFQPLVSAAPGAGQIAYNQILSGATISGLGANDIVDVTTAVKTFSTSQTAYALRTNQNINPTTSGLSLTLGSGGLIMTGGTINATGAVTAGVIVPMTLNFGAGGAGEAFIYNSATAIIQAQIAAAQGLTKFGAGQLQIHSINPGIGGPVTLHEGTTYIRVPYSGTGSAVGQVLNGQDIVVNGGTLNIQSILANAGGTASEIASTPTSAQSLLNSNIFIRGDSVLRVNGAAQYVRIADLTIGNSAGSTAMNGNSSISLELRSGIWVRGTTTLAPEARINGTFDGFSQSTLAGLVTGAGGFIKYGNGATTLMNAANDYAGGTVIWGSTNATAVSTVASALRGAGTPFSTGDIQIQPGGLLRIADAANIASNAVYLRSDAYGLGGLGLAYNGVLPSIITSGTPTAGQVKVESTGPFDGVLALDYGYYSQTLTPATLGNGNWWIGNSQQNDAYYFNSTIGASANGKYLLGGGGNQGSVQFGSILVSTGRTTLFDNIFSGGTANQVRIEVGAQTGDFAWNSPSFVNGNSGYVALTSRNTGLVGDVRVNTNTVLGLGNNFALGIGRLVMNGGFVRSDIGNNNFVTTNITLNNNVVLQGDFNTNAGVLVLLGNVAMSDVVGAGATRIWNMAGGDVAVRGVISGAAGSNLIKRGANSLTLSGANTYQGYTQIDRGTVVVSGNVLPNVAGPLGTSESPIVLGVESANNAGSLGVGGRFTIGRDIMVVAAPGTGVNLLESRTASPVTISGGISVATGAIATLGAAAADVAGFRGGQLDVQGSISGAGAVVIGTTAAAPANGGTVRLGGGINGYGGNTYSGGTTLHSARIQLNGTSYFTGPANNPTTFISGPLGTGTITFGSGEGNRGAMMEAFGGPVTIVNALNAIAHNNSLNLNFGGFNALTFTRNLDLNSDATLRTRSFVVQNMYQPVTFSGNITNTGAQGSNLVKSGPGKLILTGTNTNANLVTTDTNYGSAVFIDQGILEVNSNAALGSTAPLAAGGSHLAGPADVRLRGGYLAVSSGFTTDRQFILSNSNGGFDVASGQTLTLTKQTAGAFNIRKVGLGTLALDNSANTIATLLIGGGQQLTPGIGFTSHRGGIVSTTATSGTPFATTAVTIEGGALALIGGGTAQTLTIPTVNYGANAAIALFQGSTSSQLTATALTRQGAFNSVNYGTLTVVPTSLANLGVTERLLTSTASLNTSTGGGDILTSPSIFIRLQAAGSDANFARYDAATGIREHNVATVTTLGSSAGTNVADISAADTAGTGNIDIQAVRTSANIAPTDGTTLLRVARGGLIINGNTASIISSNTLFGTDTGASLTEAIVYVREAQTGTSAISGNITARDFTKTGPGLLEVSGATNLLNSNATRLPVLSVQDGTFRFANTGASFQNQFRGNTVGNSIGHYVLNVNEGGVFDLNGLSLFNGGITGNGTITSGVAGAVSLTVKNGFGVDPTFSGSINNGSGTVSLVKTQNGILTLNGHSTYSGGTTVQAGRVTNATGSTAVLGRLEAQTVTALGNGGVTLEGGTLRLNAATLLNGGQNISEVINGIDFLRWGGTNGLDITVSATSVSNGVTLPVNTTSYINAATQNAGLNNLTVNAPIVTFAEGLVQVNGTSTFTQANTVLRTAGGRLFLAGKVDAAGKTITKTGVNDIVLTNGAAGAGQNNVGLWVVSGGLLEARTANGDSNPFGSNATVEVNVGTNADARGLRLLTDGDGTNNAELVTTYANTNLRFGSMLAVNSSQFVSSGANRVQSDRSFIANNSFKTVQINNLEVGGALGSPQVYFVLGNNDSIKVNGTTTFLRDMTLQVDGGQGLVLNGLISGNGTFNRRSNGGTLYINADNSVAGGYDGGTFFTGGGRNYLGSLLGNQVTLSDTAKLGKGHVWVGPLASFQINSAGNLQAGQNFHVSGNLSWAGRLSLAADLSLEQIRLRSNGLGGIQDSATDYFLNARNPSSGVLALGTIYTQALDMRTLGDGMWFLGSMTNGVGGNGAYDAATLKPGLADTYRIGAAGNTLFFGTNGNANVLTDVDETKPANLVVGAPMTVQNSAPLNDGAGTVVFLQNQNYTGSTLVNRSSTLDFRGTLTTSGIETYGVVNVAGEAGTFINPNNFNNIPVTLRPGATIRFDNTSAGVLPVTETEGRWQDSVGFTLTDNVIRLQGNAAVEVVETVGAINVVSGANRLDVVRGVIGRGTELRTPSITRSGFGTLQLNTNGSQLGSDERIIITGAAPTVTNGMVAPWIINNNDIQFVTYNSDVGFTIAGFDRVQAAATLAATVTAPNDRTFFSGNVVLNSGVDFETYALRLDGNVTLGTATDNTAQLIIGSGGLLSNSTRTITAGIQAGTGTSELILFNNGTTAIGEFANPNTAGQIAASGITKFGGGTLQFLGNNASFTGDIRLQQGAVELNYRNTANVSTEIVTTIGGNGGNIIFEGAGTILNLRGGQDGTNVNFTGNTVTFNKGIVLGDYIPTATISVDRSAGSAATSQNKIFYLNGGITFGANNGDVGQVLRIDGRNGIRLQVNGTTTLTGRSSFAVENGYTGTSNDLFLKGQVTGSGMLIKGPSDSKGRNMFLFNLQNLNNYTGGTVLQGGTLQVAARASNGAANTNSNLLVGGMGNGPITLMQGVLDLRVDGAASGAADTDIEFIRYTDTGIGQDVFVKGSSQINVDRTNLQGYYTRTSGTLTAIIPEGHGYQVGQSVTVTTATGATAAPTNFTLTAVTANSITYTDGTTSSTGLFAVQQNSGNNKMITFNNLSIGSEILTVSGGNGYGVAFGGTTTLLGNAFFNNSTDFVIGGAQGTTGADNSVTTDGGRVLINKINTGTLWVHAKNNNLTGPTYINAGLLAFGNRVVGNNTATLGTGNIFVNPGGAIQVRAATNINTGLGQKVVLTGTQYSPAVFRSTYNISQAELEAMIVSPTVTSATQHAVFAHEGNLTNSYNMSTVGNGRLFIGATGDRTYSGATLSPGLPNLANAVVGGGSTNPVHRFTHISGNTLTINLSGTGNIGNVGGTTDVQIGSLATLGSANYNTGFVYFQDQNTYTGQTVVSRGLSLRFNTAMATGNTAGPLGANASSLIDIYGGLRFEGTGNLFQNGSTTDHFYNDIRLHPGSTLTFQDMTATGGGANRWGDAVGVNLDGATIVGEATDGADNNTETIGSVIFDRGSRVAVASQNNGDALLTVASVSRASSGIGAGTGRGTLVFVPSNAGPTVTTVAFGAALTAASPQQQVKFTSAPTASATSAVSGMLPGYYIDGQSHRFVTHNATTGIVPVADGSMAAMPAGAGLGTEVVNLTAATTMSSFETSIFALRGGNFALNSPTGANNDATITFTGSGADIGAVISYATTFTINPNLKFGATGANEALFYAAGNMTVNGNITAGSITKFGTGQLTIANDQSDAARGVGNGYQGGWVVNEGNLQLSQFGSAGNAHANNTIVLNSSQATSSPTLLLRAQPGDTLLNYTYTSGRIIAVDNATIDWDPGADDRVHTIADVEIQQSGGIGNGPANGTVDAQLRIANNRSRSILAAGTLTVTNNAILNVDTTATGSPFSAYGGNGGYLTNGLSSGFSVASLVGSQRLTKWGDGTLYIRGDSSGTFSGTMVIDQGAVHVTHNGSLGTGALIINRYGALDIGVANFTATNSSVTYNEGSIERWSVNNARSGAVNLGKGTLQVAANQPTTNASVTLDGGGIEAFLRNDDINGAQAGGGVMRILNPNVTFTLNSNSFIGTQYYLGANGLDNGKQAMDNLALTEYAASGAILEVQGVIGGTGGLTKVGYDTVILSGSNTYAGPTGVEGGRLLLGKNDALPTTTTLTTTSNGVLDLNGQNQTVGTLTNPGTPATGVNSTSGFITNAATTVNTLTVGNGVTSNFTYSGVIQHNVALTKTGTATMTLNNANTYTGNTVITGGTLALGQNGSINDSPVINIGSSTILDVSAKTSGYTYDGVIKGGGLDPAGTTYATVSAAGRINGSLTLSDHVAELSGIGSMSPGDNSVGHLYVGTDLTLSGQLVGTTGTAVTRLALDITSATVNANTLGAFDYTGAWLTTNAASYLTSTAGSGSLAGHDYVNVGGALTLNQYGRVVVSNLGGSFAGGDVFNLLDWSSLTNNGFTVSGTQYDGTGDAGFDLDLPDLTAGLLWDTSLFTTYGVVFVVPEPSRALFLMIGLLGLMMRRRRKMA
ncbi:MAG: autotransporter-associated beta strand repeat-containing protein [Verrucomicrobiaceae bacterium]|nr:autotransporter-associated beta strand repeat-containing protein [Verrucomicrobiaceae bacterium]